MFGLSCATIATLGAVVGGGILMEPPESTPTRMVLGILLLLAAVFLLISLRLILKAGKPREKSTH